jgi:hypothetical protein
MTDQQHPITPPPDELVEQWREDNLTPENLANYVATQAARWGADQELEACIGALRWRGAASQMMKYLRATRRPKPPSLKEQALEALAHLQEDEPNYQSSFDTIRRALEALPNE